MQEVAWPNQVSREFGGNRDELRAVKEVLTFLWQVAARRPFLVVCPFDFGAL